MKNFLMLFVCLLFSAVASAQLATVNIAAPNTSSTLIETDYTLTNTTVGYVLFKAPLGTPATQDYLVKLDSVSGNHTNIAVKVYGQKFDQSAFVQIGSTINWKGTTTSHDTIIVFSNATANRYRNYKVEFTGTGTGVSKINYQQFKLYQEKQ